MDRSSLNQLDLPGAVDLLARRRLASQQVGGFIKVSFDQATLGRWRDSLMEAAGKAKGTLSDAASGIWNAKPDLQAATQSGNMGQYWSDTAREALRNALIGGGVGGSIGALKGIISGDDDVLGNMASGGLVGATIGGGGTGLYRGGKALFAPSKTQQDQELATIEGIIQRQKAIDAARQNSAGPAQRIGALWSMLVNRQGTGEEAADIAMGIPRGGMLTRAVMGQNVLPNQGEKYLGTAEKAMGGGGLGWLLGHGINRSFLRRDMLNAGQSGPGVSAPKGGTGGSQIPVDPTAWTATTAGGASGRWLPTRANMGRWVRECSPEYWRHKGSRPADFYGALREQRGNFRNKLPRRLATLGAFAGLLSGSSAPDD